MELNEFFNKRAKRVVSFLRNISQKGIRRIFFWLLTIPDSRILLTDQTLFEWNWAANLYESHGKEISLREQISDKLARSEVEKTFLIGLRYSVFISFYFLVFYYHRLNYIGSSVRKRIALLSLSFEFSQRIHSLGFILEFFYQHTFRKRVSGRWNYSSCSFSFTWHKPEVISRDSNRKEDNL